MAEITKLNVAELDFDTIKTNLKDYFGSQSEFTDHNFDGSAISVLLDILAYNTHYNAYYLNMLASESFLDSAQLRDSVVAKASMLGYTPRSVRGSQAYVDITITPGDAPASITIDKDTQFTSTVNGTSYTFATANSTVVSPVSGVYKAEDVLTSAFNYTLETYNQEEISVLQHGFTSFFMYNTFQNSGENVLEYLVNTRRIGNNWKINKFRDMAAAAVDTSNYYMSTNTNVIGGINTGTVTTSSTNNMFVYDGMDKTINAAYLDLTKNWNLQRKFIDKWVGIRLIYDNISNNSLNLYSTEIAVRKMHR